MTITLSSLTLETALPAGASVLVSRTDLTDPSKLIFDRVTVAALTAGIVISGSTSATVQAIEIGVLNLVVPFSLTPDTATPVLLYQITDPADVSNLMLEQIEIQYQDVIGSKFTYEVWAGLPGASGSQKLSAPVPDIFFTQYFTLFRNSTTAYMNNSVLRVGIYLNVINRLTSPLKFSAKLGFLKLPPVLVPVVLPAFVVTPFVYTGPTGLTTVEVGPGQTFPEMADAMPYVAPGFTMNVHAGSYFKPFYIPQGMDGYVIQAAVGVTADQIVCNGRGGWVTGAPAWTDNNPPTGQVNPFRLSRGKAFILTNSPGTIRKIGFWYCGGGLGRNLPGNLGDGEAGIYPENFAVLSDMHVERCTFDGNENGIFAPGVGAGATGGNVRLYIDHCDFSFQVNNGQSPDGLSHNVYVSCREVHATYCNFYGCSGNSFKSRAPLVTIDNSFLEAGAGRAIDFPEGGSLTVTSSIISQKTSSELQHNLIGLSNENLNNGPGQATFSACTLKIQRYDTAFFIRGAGAYAHFSPAGGTACTLEWYPISSLAPSLTYDTQQGSTTTAVDGLPGQVGTILPYIVATGGTIVAGNPVRPPPIHLA